MSVATTQGALAGAGTLEEQFTTRHMQKLARDFSFPTVLNMVATWGYRRTYQMACSMVNAGWGWSTNRTGPR